MQCLCVALTVSEAEHRSEPAGQICIDAGFCPLCDSKERGVQDRGGRRGAHVTVRPGGVQVYQVNMLVLVHFALLAYIQHS